MKRITNSIIEDYNNENSYMVLNPLSAASLKNITPLPQKAELGLPINSYEENGYSNPTQLIPFECTCGRDIGVFTRAISILSLENKNKDFDKDICSHFDLNGCCRLKIIAPIVAPVVSLDINAFVDDGYEVVEKGYKWPTFKMF